MIAFDTSVAVKWYKPGERFETEALNLGTRITAGQAEAAACEIISLEVVRGLRRAQTREPGLGITDAQIESAFLRMETYLSVGNVLECSVREVKTLAKDMEMALGLFMADALHLATALHLKAEYFVVDDHHFLTPEVVSYAAGSGVRIVNLPDLIAALNTSPTNGSEATNQDP